MSTKPVVAVAMSGGVDSSVAAALLVEQGYKVFGVMLNLWSEPGSANLNRCCTPDSQAMARQVASILSIPFYVLDARQLFYDSVIKPFIYDYTHNRTPNPCVTCNRLVRWGFLLSYVLAAGADFLATGHYARLSQNTDGTYRLSRGVDTAKDQSYVMHVLTQEKLAHAIFPLGEHTKKEVRQMASKHGLPVANRPDSQDLCFIGASGKYAGFLAKYAPQARNPGPILDRQGRILGQHQGLAFYTIGQRKGLRLASPVPLYVLEKDLQSNIIVVGPRAQSGSKQFVTENVNWIEAQPSESAFPASVKIRYTGHDISGMVNLLDGDRFRVEFESQVPDITPGQAAVLYNGDVCLGGGIISDQSM